MRTPTFKMAVAAGALLASAGMARAWVPDLTDDGEKAAFGQLIDIYKQQAKFVACVVKATVKCEGKYGMDVATQDCVMATATGPAGSGFAEALASCESKVDYSKKSATGDASADYTTMQCPGDNDSTTPGNQDYTDVEDWQGAHDSTYAQLDALALLANVLGNAAGKDIKTLGKDIGELSKYGQSLFKCIGSCEGDSKGSKGGGALTDSLTQCSAKSADTPDPVQDACRDGARAKMESKLGAGGGTYAALIPLIDNALTDAASSTWNNTEGCDGSPSGAFVDGSSLF